MKIETLYGQGLEATRYMERYVNNVKSGSHSDWSDTNVRYSPHEGIEQFPVPVFGLKPETVTVMQANPDPKLLGEMIGKEVVKFFVHPDMLEGEGYLERVGIDPNSQLSETYIVTPTSSTRTLLTVGRDPNFMVKTDLDKRHYRFIRRLKGSSVEHSILVSRELERIVTADHPAEYAFLPESLGVIAGDAQTGAGVLFREVTPRPTVPQTRILVPYFSFYATDLKNPNDEPLLIQLIKQNTKPGDEMGFFVDQVLGKIVRNWTYFASQHGLLLELHGQNTLLELDENMKPQRIVHRDFQGIYFDRQIREQNGLAMPVSKHVTGEEEGTTRETQFSIAYDHQVGDYLFDRLITTFRSFYPEYTFEQIAVRAQEMFRQGFPMWKEVFPEATYTYGKQTGNEVNLVVKHEKGIFR